MEKKKPKQNNLEQLSSIVLHARCFPQCYLNNGARGEAIVIPMYYLEFYASWNVD